LIAADSEFLAQQLRSESIRLLLVNGMTAVRQLELNISGPLDPNQAYPDRFCLNNEAEK
jgi:hypothetical protein